jgi:hypothetical protein
MVRARVVSRALVGLLIDIVGNVETCPLSNSVLSHSRNHDFRYRAIRAQIFFHLKASVSQIFT